MRLAIGSRHEAPLILHGAGTSCRVRPWSFTSDTAHLVFYNQQRTPTVDDVRRWMDQLGALGYRAIRTGALGLMGASVVEDLDFELVQTLVLLEHLDPASAPRPDRDLRRLAAADLPAASTTDLAAFGNAWGIDAATIADMTTATPRHRMRALLDTADASPFPVSGYAVSGRDGRLGFLQRLAVHPSVQHQGVGTALVADSLRWLARWRATRVLVNTHVDNHGALRLYHRMGFTTLPDRLRVYQRALP